MECVSEENNTYTHIHVGKGIVVVVVVIYAIRRGMHETIATRHGYVIILVTATKGLGGQDTERNIHQG